MVTPFFSIAVGGVLLYTSKCQVLSFPKGFLFVLAPSKLENGIHSLLISSRSNSSSNSAYPDKELSSNSFLASLKASAMEEAAPEIAPITSTVEAATSCASGDFA